MASSDDFSRLQEQLAPLSHGTQALEMVREFLKGLGRVAARQRFLADHMLRPPIYYEDIRGYVDVEPFHVLQGDVIRTDAAYIVGARQIGYPSYVVATSTCDLVPGRRETALLLCRSSPDVQTIMRHGRGSRAT